MTVKELFNSLSFDEIVNALQNTHRNDDSVSCLYGYKEAFDIISNTEFNGDGGEVTFDVTPREEFFYLVISLYLPIMSKEIIGKT